jgi:hypothetical protein
MSNDHGSEGHNETGCSECIAEASRDADKGDNQAPLSACSGLCFIATAVYGNNMAPEVVTLRKFRDNVLKKNKLGRSFIVLYYKHSPPVAEWMKKKPTISSIVRVLLNQVVKMVK